MPKPLRVAVTFPPETERVLLVYPGAERMSALVILSPFQREVSSISNSVAGAPALI